MSENQGQKKLVQFLLTITGLGFIGGGIYLWYSNVVDMGVEIAGMPLLPLVLLFVGLMDLVFSWIILRG